MNKGTFFEIGDSRIIYYQKFIVALGVLSLIFSLVLLLFNPNPYYRYFPFITTIGFLNIILLYSKLYSVRYDASHFYIRNLFRKEQIESSNFIKVEGVKYLSFLLVIVFKEKRYYSLINSDEFYKNYLKSSSSFYKDTTSEIMRNIFDTSRNNYS